MTDKIESGVEYGMSKPELNFSRRERKNNRKRKDRILNSLIGLVVVLIIIVASMIFWGNGDKNQVDGEKIVDTEKETDQEDGLNLEDDSETPNKDNETDVGEQVDKPEQNQNQTPAPNQENSTDQSKPDDSGIEKIERTNEDVVSETIVNSTWKAIGTEQVGEHVSSYDGESIDWIEKKKAIAYATGHSVDSLNYWKVKNGGSPQKSIGIVSVK